MEEENFKKKAAVNAHEETAVSEHPERRTWPVRSKRLLVGGQAHLETILLLPSEEKSSLDCK